MIDEPTRFNPEGCSDINCTDTLELLVKVLETIVKENANYITLSCLVLKVINYLLVNGYVEMKKLNMERLKNSLQVYQNTYKNVNDIQKSIISLSSGLLGFIELGDVALHVWKDYGKSFSPVLIMRAKQSR